MEDYSRLKVSELKDRLRALKLPLKGKKAELVARLQAAASVSTVQGPLQPTRATLGTSAVGSSATRPALPDPAPAGNIASIPRAKESASKGKEQAFSVLAEPSTPKKPRFDPPSASHRTPALLSRPTHAPAFASGPKKPGTPLNPAVWGSPPAHLASARLDRTLARPEQFLLTGNTSTEPTRGAAAAKKPTRAPFKPLIVSTRRASSARSPPSSAPRIPTFVPPNSLLPTNVSPPDAWPERLYASLVPPLPFPSIPPSLMSQTEAAALAHRVIVSRLYLILGRASYSSPGEAKAVLESLPPVLGAQRVVEGLWLVMLGDGTKVHVLEATGEVVGSEAEIEELQLGQPNPVLELHLRADWAAWIEDRKKGRGKRLHELVKGGDVEEYPEGLSKGMRTKAASDQDLAASAVKYLLAQVTPNGISGSHSTPLAEAQLAASLPVEPLPTRSQDRPDLGFFLPSSLCLEALLLPSPTNQLHRNLMIAQTAGAGALFCLSETGQAVGNEDEGVAPMWMKLLGCDEKGQV